MAASGEVSGTAVGVATVGGLLLYAALRDTDPLVAARAVVSARPPGIPDVRSVPLVAGSVAAGATDGAYGDRIVAAARRYLGVPYRWGGATPNGFDCSGLVTWVLHRDLGLKLPNSVHTVTGQFLVWSGATTVAPSSRRPGDLMCWAGHIAIYSGGDWMIEAARPGTSVREVTYRPGGSTFRRVIRQSGTSSNVPDARLPGTAF